MKKRDNYKFDDFITDDSFTKFAKGKSSSDWEQWLRENPDKSETAQAAKLFISNFRFKKKRVAPKKVSSEWLKLSERLALDKQNINGRLRTVTQMKSWRLAASLALLVSLLGGLLYSGGLFSESETYTIIEAPYGQIKRITLPDSTLVVLNSGTRLKYGSRFNKWKRNVVLSGEAYFDVSHSTFKTFEVQTSNNTVRVLGTAFNVMAYTNENTHKITLERGSVQVLGQVGSEQLKPKQAYVLQRTENLHKVVDYNDIAVFSAWRTGMVVLRNQSCMELTQKLERSHKMHFKVENEELKTTRYSGAFRTKDPITKILKVINATTPINYKVVGDTMFIR